MKRRDVVLDANRKALDIRRSANIGIWDSICIYDLVSEFGIDIRFVDIPSLEGMYYKNINPLILVSTLRPSGRQAFTCAHEFAHHIYDHGTRIDELLENPKSRSDPEEFLSDRFASLLLMPKSAVSRAFFIRGWQNIELCTPLQIYTIAGWLGVGYETLITHMVATLHLISSRAADKFQGTSPKQIKSSVLGYESGNNLIIVDTSWMGRAVDIEVGDLVLLPPGTFAEGNCVQLVHEDFEEVLYCGNQPGIGRFEHRNSGWASFVRVSRKGYTGLSEFRHLEEQEDD